MPKICVCLEPLFGDAFLAEKARRVADAGFSALEFWFYDNGPGDRNLDALTAVCRDKGLLVNDMVVNAPEGSMGSLVTLDDRERYLARLREVIAVARKLDCPKLITCSGNTVAGKPRSQQHRAMVLTLKKAATIAAQEGITLLLEPLNSLVDHAGYYLDSGHEAAQVVEEVNSPAVRLLWDVYHMQIMHGNVLANIEKYLPLIGHFHAAGVPGRHELDSGELNYPTILARISSWGYAGCFGLEYFPAKSDHALSLVAMRALTAGAGWG